MTYSKNVLKYIFFKWFELFQCSGGPLHNYLLWKWSKIKLLLLKQLCQNFGRLKNNLIYAKATNVLQYLEQQFFFKTAKLAIWPHSSALCEWSLLGQFFLLKSYYDDKLSIANVHKLATFVIVVMKNINNIENCYAIYLAKRWLTRE
jgi:hypothetical protein